MKKKNEDMKRWVILGLASFLMATQIVTAGEPDTLWKNSADFNLALTQNAYSDSWAGGEAGNATWIATLNTLFEGPLSGSIHLKSTNKLSFGQTMTQDPETKKWKKPLKSTDLIDLEQIFSYSSSWSINPYFGLRFESQFIDASIDSVKRYINPFTVTESAGFTKRLYQKEKQFIDTRLGFAMREFFMREIVDTATQTTASSSTTDGGLESVTDLNLMVHQNIKWTSKLSMFKALTVSSETADNWSTMDVNWENIFVASVTKYISVNLYLQILYDKQINLKGRFKESLALGFTYKLM